MRTNSTRDAVLSPEAHLVPDVSSCSLSPRSVFVCVSWGGWKWSSSSSSSSSSWFWSQLEETVTTDKIAFYVVFLFSLQSCCDPCDLVHIGFSDWSHEGGCLYVCAGDNQLDTESLLNVTLQEMTSDLCCFIQHRSEVSSFSITDSCGPRLPSGRPSRRTNQELMDADTPTDV